MKLPTFALAVLLALPWSLSAETIMISLSASSVPMDQPGKAGSGKLLLSALEDGLLDTFFQAGHIVFNAELFTAGVQDKTAMVKVAKEGGASKLLSVGLVLPGQGSADFERVEYALISLADQRTVASGLVKASELVRKPEVPKDIFFAELGRTVAKKVLGKKG